MERRPPARLGQCQAPPRRTRQVTGRCGHLEGRLVPARRVVHRHGEYGAVWPACAPLGEFSCGRIAKKSIVLTELQAYKHNPEVREELWDAIKTTAELLDKVDIKKEIK